jgi:HEAT repeat protein
MGSWRNRSISNPVALLRFVRAIAGISLALVPSVLSAQQVQAIELPPRPSPAAAQPIDSLAQGRSELSPANLSGINIDNQLNELRTAEPYARDELLNDLKEKGATIVPQLTQALQDPDPLVSSAAMEVLGSLRADAQSAIPALLDLLSDRRRWIVPSGQSSGSFFPPSLPPLQILPPSIPTDFSFGETVEAPAPAPPDNPNRLLRATAAATLGQIGTSARTAATPKLQEALQDADPWMRLNTAWALMQIGADAPVLPTLVNLLQTPDAEVRGATAALLGDESSLIGKILSLESTPETTAALITALDDPQSLTRLQLSRSLLLVGTEAIAPLIQALSSPSPLLRLEATKTLGMFRQQATSALPKLSELLQDSGQYQANPRALDQGNPFGIPLPAPLPVAAIRLPSEGFNNRYDWEEPENNQNWVNVEAALSIGKIVGETPVPTVQSALLSALQSSSLELQVAAAWALLKMISVTFLPVDEATAIETQVVNRLGAIAQSILASATPVRYRYDMPPSPAINATRLLESIGQPAAIYLLPYYLSQLNLPNQNDKVQAILAFRGLESSALPAVATLRDRFLAGDDDILRGYTATILGEIAMTLQNDHWQGRLSESNRQQAIRDFEQVLAIMRSPQYRFNQEPIDRVTTSLEGLKR